MWRTKVPINLKLLTSIGAALSEESRIRIIEALGKKSLNLSQISSVCDMTLPLTCYHVKVLLGAEVVTFRKEGKFKVFSLAPRWIEQVMEMLKEIVK
jgi:DNA-binding transcriptional ArsR family regulator